MERIACVQEALQLPQQREQPSRDESKTPTDVFKSIVQANRQLNILLEHEFSPADVYGQIQVANDYSAELLTMLTHFNEQPTVTVTEMPPYKRGKRPEDVYQRLTECFALVGRIAQTSGLSILEFAPDPSPTITPSDVHDVTALIVSELYYFSTLLHSKLPEVPLRHQRKLPSHVYQRSELLHAQLTTIEGLVERYPNWHTMR